MIWERETLEPRFLGDGPGTRLRFVDEQENVHATIVRYPATMWRVYMPGGPMVDRSTEEEARAVAEMMVKARSTDAHLGPAVRPMETYGGGSDAS